MRTVSLKQNRAFRAVYGRGKSFANRLLVMYVLQGAPETNRLGVTVSRKVGGAVTRNRVRRLIKENFRQSEPDIVIGYDMVIVARAAAGRLKRAEAFGAVGAALRHLLTKHQLVSRNVP